MTSCVPRRQGRHHRAVPSPGRATGLSPVSNSWAALRLHLGCTWAAHGLRMGCASGRPSPTRIGGQTLGALGGAWRERLGGKAPFLKHQLPACTILLERASPQIAQPRAEREALDPARGGRSRLFRQHRAGPTDCRGPVPATGPTAKGGLHFSGFRGNLLRIAPVGRKQSTLTNVAL